MKMKENNKKEQDKGKKMKKKVRVSLQQSFFS